MSKPRAAPVIDILDHRQMAQPGTPSPALVELLIARHLMLEQDAEPFGMIQRGRRRIGRQFLEASGAAFQSRSCSRSRVGCVNMIKTSMEVA